ncbi:hypothetical protein [Patiriisocius sp. Uisw_017]|jgi:hypothetical protein|uniref:hypothetical protein n=1 Tax=Patiriisocius sp. Uisw_017 TaxID=3230968 RepID=UPI0039ED994A
MIKCFFKTFVEKEDRKFSFPDKDAGIGGGIRAANLICLLLSKYKDVKISIKNSTG